jgi:predicted GNAT superfamily acetyltransferase
MRLRPPVAADAAAVLALNHADVQYLAPMDGPRWSLLSGSATFARVAEVDGEVAAFVLVFAPTDVYDSLNFAWFRERYARFWYLDRIVVSPQFRRRGIAQAIYDAAEGGAVDAGQERLLCEVNVLPPNDASLQFHAQRGYTEVGRRGTEAEGKVLSMLAKELGAPV